MRFNERDGTEWGSVQNKK